MPSDQTEPATAKTTKRLLVLRHATALFNQTSDFDRTLAPQGTEDAVALGQEMQKKGLLPDIILCSPAMRTRETLEAVQRHMSAGIMDMPETFYNAPAGTYLNAIQNVSDDYNTILVVGHNPGIHHLVALLAAKGADSTLQRLSEGYQPATLSEITCHCKKWAEIQPDENTLTTLISPIDYNAPARPTRWM